VDELVDLFTLKSVLALEDGNGQRAQLRRLRPDGEARHPAQQAARVPETVEEPRGAPEQGQLLLEVHVDAAQENALRADVLLVGTDRRVGGDEQGVMAQGVQGAD